MARTAAILRACPSDKLFFCAISLSPLHKQRPAATTSSLTLHDADLLMQAPS